MNSLVMKTFTDFAHWKKVEYFWLVIALIVVGLGSWQASPLEFTAALTNVVCVILVAKGRVSNYYWGTIGVITYGIVSYNTGLYANAALNAIYLPMQFIGIYYWTKDLGKTPAKADVAVKTITLRDVITYLVVGVIFWYGLTEYLKTTQDPFPALDAFCLVASLIAMWMMIKQQPEQWILWIIINCVTIYLWVIPALNQPGSWAQVAQWAVFLMNAFYGLWKWYITKTNK